MTAKALRNPALRTKFKVGDMVTLPRTVWSRLISKMINFDRVDVEVSEVGDTIIEHGKNRLCRFAIKLGHGTNSLFSGKVVWEEWILDRITVLFKASPKLSTADGELAAMKVIIENFTPPGYGKETQISG